MSAVVGLSGSDKLLLETFRTMMLEQITRKHDQLRAKIDAETKTVGVALPLPIHSRLLALQDKKNPQRNTLKKLALICIELGLERLEHVDKAS